MATQDAIACGDDINFEKSRDMGASWLLLMFADYLFLFHEAENIGCVSRKESLVDRAGDMDTLFEKIRYINRMCPSWLLPPIHDTFMSLQNLELDSSIAGESTNANVGRGGRKTLYIVDEAAAIGRAEDVEASLSQNAACMIWVSTPQGPSTQFHKRIIEKRGRHIQLPWYRHPEKAQGAYQTIDDTGNVKWTSPWYEKQKEKYSNKTVAQEIDMDHGQSGDTFFDATELEIHRQDHEQEPIARGKVIWVDSYTENQQIELMQQMDDTAMAWVPDSKAGNLRLWCPLINGRPPQDRWSYIFGIDISNGSGASNSVITVAAAEIGQVVAKWWSAFVSPEHLAMKAAQLGVWFGGLRGPAFMVWENNGPGGIFGRKVVQVINYPRYYRQRLEGQVNEKRTKRWGWHSTNEKKEIMLGMYRDALAKGNFINPCKESLDEAQDYIYDDTGSLIPSALREEKSGGKSLHGDHVIADGLAYLGTEEAPRRRMTNARAPKGSFEYYRAQRKKRARRLGA